MGEAKRRNSIIQDIPPARRADIAHVVRSFEMVTGRGGTCSFRACLGHHVLNRLGIRSTIVFGAMLYRAGPHPMRDVVAFCGPGNKPLAGVLAHCWLHCGNDLIDFSVGDWQPQASRVVDSAFDRLPTGETLEPIQWTAPALPDFWWRPRSSFDPWQPTGEPKLGEAWYHPARMPDELLAAFAEIESEAALMRILDARCKQLADNWRNHANTQFPTTSVFLPA